MRALITGANRGIGAALRAAGLQAGHEILSTARTPADTSGWYRLDQTRQEDIAALAAALEGVSLDLLVLNSGVFLDRGQPLDTGFGADLWHETFAVNVTGTFQVAQALLPNVRSARGKIAIISSQMGSSERAWGGAYIYRASKAAEVNLMRNLAVDLRDAGVAVGAYHPGWVQTDMGGAEADIDVATSAAGLWQRFDALDMTTTGCFEAYDGAPMPF